MPTIRPYRELPRCGWYCKNCKTVSRKVYPRPEAKKARDRHVNRNPCDSSDASVIDESFWNQLKGSV